MLILNHTDPLDHLFTSGFAVQTCHKFRSIFNWRLITTIEGLSLQYFRSYDLLTETGDHDFKNLVTLNLSMISTLRYSLSVPQDAPGGHSSMIG